MPSRAKCLVILGGGFGGVYAALTLEKVFRRDDNIEIVLLSNENFLLFTPMLPEVPSSSIEAKHIISPLRAFFRKVKFQSLDWIQVSYSGFAGWFSENSLDKSVPLR